MSLSDNETINFNYGMCKYKNIMGVTCYINSILHILQQTPMFMEYISQAKFRDTIMNKIESKIEEDDNLEQEELLGDFVIFELFRLFKTSLENDDSVITPNTFKKLIGKKNDMWNEINHQDSQEFFNFLITQLQEEAGTKCEFIPGNIIKNSNSDESFDSSIHNILSINSWISYHTREYSPLRNMFDGMLEQSKKCMCCSATSLRYEPFLTFGLSIPIKSKEDMNKSFDIYECLDHLFTEEQLDSDNKITCELCGLKNKAHSKSLLWKTPKILIFHIKRFLVNSFGITTQKITNKVNYPIKDLDLSKYFNPNSPYIKNSKYDLYAINLHQAFGYKGNVNSGHYTSIIKNIMNNYWYLYNDSSPVKKIHSKDELQKSDAYLLFYYRHN